MSNSKITTKTIVRGEVLLKVQARKGAISPIYEILAKAPTIIEDQYPVVYELTRSAKRKSPSPDNNFCDEFILKFSGPVNRTLKETSNEVQNLVKYLKSCKEILSANGNMSVNEIYEINGIKDECDEETGLNLNEITWSIEIDY